MNNLKLYVGVNKSKSLRSPGISKAFNGVEGQEEELLPRQHSDKWDLSQRLENNVRKRHRQCKVLESIGKTLESWVKRCWQKNG